VRRLGYLKVLLIPTREVIWRVDGCSNPNLCWIVAYRAWGYGGLRIWRVGAMPLGDSDGRVSGMWLCGSDSHLSRRGFVHFTSYAGRHRVLFLWFRSHSMRLVCVW